MSDPLDWISIETGHAAINMASGTMAHDIVLARHITAISRIGDDAVGPVVHRIVTAELHAGGAPTILLRRRPVSTITNVREAQNPGTIETLSAAAWGSTSDGYFAPPWKRDPTLKSGEIHRRRSGVDANWWPGSHTVEVTYIAGRYATTDSVDARFADVAGAILRRLWKRESGTWAQSSSFFEDADVSPSSPFFRAVRPVIEEMLTDDLQHNLAGFA